MKTVFTLQERQQTEKFLDQQHISDGNVILVRKHDRSDFGQKNHLTFFIASTKSSSSCFQSKKTCSSKKFFTHRSSYRVTNYGQ